MSNYNLAIELGTTNTVIYKHGTGIVLKEPSLIAINNDGKGKTLHAVGEKAKALIGKTGSQIEVVEPIVEGVIVNKQLAQIMLKEFLKKIDCYNLSKQKVVFCVPVGITEKEKNRLLSLAYGLNFYTVSLIPVSVCGLVGMDINVQEPHSHMIVSMGGGLTDIAIVTSSFIVRGCSVTIAGKNLSIAIDKHLLDNHSLIIGYDESEKVKKELVSLLKNDKNKLAVTGLDADTKNKKEVTLTSGEFLPIVTHFFTRIAETIETLLALSSSEVIADITKYGIYISGGLSNITGVEKFLREQLAYPIFIDTDPNNTIINGAGAIIENRELLNFVLKFAK